MASMASESSECDLDNENGWRLFCKGSWHAQKLRHCTGRLNDLTSLYARSSHWHQSVLLLISLTSVIELNVYIYIFGPLIFRNKCIGCFQFPYPKIFMYKLRLILTRSRNRVNSKKNLLRLAFTKFHKFKILPS